MATERPSTIVKPHHCLVENMFSGMHTGIIILLAHFNINFDVKITKWQGNKQIKGLL
jgi:hypothetical protein